MDQAEEEGNRTGWAELARSLRKNRELFGYTVREAALRAGISKNTVLRIESGLPVHKESLAKLYHAYGGVANGPAGRKPSGREGKYFRVQEGETLVWYATRVDALGRAESVHKPEYMQAEERKRLGSLGLVSHFGQPLRCRREGSRFIPFLVELYERSDVSSAPSGERFLYCLRGSVTVEVGDERFVLQEGEAACIDTTQPNCLEPTHPKPDPAPLILQIVMP